jgi:RNA polymerase sigma factor (sigma-70 family)
MRLTGGSQARLLRQSRPCCKAPGVRYSYEEKKTRRTIGSRLDKNAFMRACREGGDAIEKALRSLDRAFFEHLFRECMRAVRDSEAARDLVQDTFIKVWRRCATFRGQSELLPWIRSILRNAILDRVRRAHPEIPFDEDEAMQNETERRVAELSEQYVPTPHDEVRRRQLAECFARCWRRFESAAPEYAMVIGWIVEDGLSNEEISEVLGRTPGATREFISQCRKRARVHLAEWYELAFGSG